MPLVFNNGNKKLTDDPSRKKHSIFSENMFEHKLNKVKIKSLTNTLYGFPSTAKEHKAKTQTGKENIRYNGIQIFCEQQRINDELLPPGH